MQYLLLALAIIVLLVMGMRLLRRRAPMDAAIEDWVEPADLADRLAAHADLALIDVRGADEFSGPLGHIAGAGNLPVDRLAAKPDLAGQAKNRPVILVCRTERRSATAASALRAAGFANVGVLKGGMERWNREGRPVER